jgi:hypothetical protein
MEDLFHLSVSTSWDLVKEQARLIKKTGGPKVEVIVLCGGLGSSPYVRDKFKTLCQKDFKKEVTLIQPLKPWSAVCRGAALRGLQDGPILSRRSRASYGFAAHEDFKPEKHKEVDAIWDQEFGKRAKDQMFWPVEKVRIQDRSRFQADTQRTRNLNLAQQRQDCANIPCHQMSQNLLVKKFSTSVMRMSCHFD